MYYSYSYSSMKLKPDLVRYPNPSYTGRYTYSDWKNKFSVESYGHWATFCRHFGETFQFALLRGMTVVGIECDDWYAVFGDVAYERSPFQDITKLYVQKGLQADWRFFAQKLANETRRSLHYPAGCPFWLFPYGYNQKTYLQDLSVYWDNIHDDYSKPWETLQIGEDSPEVARMKRLGEAARQEIDRVARHSKQNLKR